MRIERDYTFLQGLALTHLVDEVYLKRYPKRPRKKLKRHNIDHDLDGLLWCGPAVVSAVTGAPTSEVKELIRKYRKKPTKPVRGTTDEELSYALEHYGCKLMQLELYGGLRGGCPSFNEWIKETTGDRFAGLGYALIINGPETGPHWVVILDDHYLCSNSNEWLPVSQALFKGSAVESVYEIRRL